MRKFKFEGATYEYDETALTRYSVIKGVSRFQSDPAGFFDSFAIIFAGHDDEYAERLGDDIEKMAALFAACMEDSGRAAKN